MPDVPRRDDSRRSPSRDRGCWIEYNDTAFIINVHHRVATSVSVCVVVSATIRHGANDGRGGRDVSPLESRVCRGHKIYALRL